MKILAEIWTAVVLFACFSPSVIGESGIEHVPYMLEFQHMNSRVERIHSRHLGQISALRDLTAVALAFAYKKTKVLCAMDKKTTVYSSNALKRMHAKHPPVSFESSDCVLTFLNESDFDGVAFVGGTLLHFHREDHEKLELDRLEGEIECATREVEVEGRQLRGSVERARGLLSGIFRSKPDLWVGCYPGVSLGYKLNMGIAVGSMFQSNFPNTAAFVQSILSKANVIYKYQLNIELVVDHLYTGSAPYNAECPNGATKQLDAFQLWTKPSKQGLWHLLDDCRSISGSHVGEAYRGALCKAANTAITYCTGRACSLGFRNFAHEVGHNFNARHSFEEGKLTTGGIMDYGDGLLNRIFQFNTKYRRNEICEHLRSVVGSCSSFKPNTRSESGSNPTGSPSPSSTSTSYPTSFPTPTPTAYPSKFPTRR